MKKLLFVLFLSQTINVFGELPFEGQSYYYVVFFSDILNPGFKFTFTEGKLLMDIPEEDLAKVEEGQFIAGKIDEPYKVLTDESFTRIKTRSHDFYIFWYEKDVCILYDIKTGNSYWGVNQTSPHILIDPSTKRFRGTTVFDLSSKWGKFSSFLVENVGGKERKYNGVGLNQHHYNYDFKPWVEGANGQGLGEWAEVYSPRNRIVIMSGFIDPTHPDLFKKNSRVKKIQASFGSESLIFNLRDTPQPQLLELPASFKAGIVRLTILDVYPGSKYEDTAISSIFFP